MRILRTVRTVAALIALALCGPAAVNTVDAARAKATAERWQGSPQERAWREGFVPLQSLALEPGRAVPYWALVSAHNGAWKLGADLPSRPPAPVRVRWSDGSAALVPLVSASVAFARLRRPGYDEDASCPAGGCRVLRVVGAVQGKTTMATSRGPITVPTWEFTVEGVDEPFRRIAVDPAAMSRPPKARSWQRVYSYRVVADNELELQYGHNPCTTTHGARVYETSAVVVVDVEVRETDVEHCDEMLHTDPVRTTLDRPLGTRVVLDARSGVPLVPGTEERQFWSEPGWNLLAS
ncbi:hypothetical protein [Nonomuraea longicatena]|uniref:Uncharacterized protein n=1 Tax=Nonomuraea longicatena TaxID=83682 RepID=A0ABP4BNC1_9ACTN